MADIAINPVDRRVQFTGNTGTGPFAFTFNIFADEDLAVYKNTTLLTLTTDYTVSINANGTGSITLVAPLIASDVLTIIGGRELSRTTDFVTAGDLLAASLNEQLDSLVIMAQQLDEKMTRSFKVNPGDVFTDLEMPLLADRKGKYLAFNSTTGDPEAGPDQTDVVALSSITSDIARLADIEDGTLATNAIQTAASISSDIATVSGISANVTTVAGNTTNINAVAADASDIGVVSANIASVNTVATNIADVITVANDLNEAVSEIVTVADDLNEAVSEIDTVANSISNVNTVGTNIANVNTVAGISANVTTVAGISADTSTVAGISGNVTTVAGISADVTAVAADATDIGTVSTNIADVNTAAANIVAIQNASANAATATTKAAEASTSATNAATSETNAASSASASSTSASNAATSASAASTSASAASTSASNAATSASSASSAQTAAEAARDSALAAFDSFDDRYLGTKASDPALDNDGNALVAGALYFNTTASAMKVYTGSAWVAAYVSGTDYLALSGGEMTGDVLYGDNVKAKFGAGSDLQIYHDGSNSYISELGTGDLRLGAVNIRIGDNTSGANYIYATQNAEVTLYHNNSAKLATESGGVNITGTLTSDGLTVGAASRVDVDDNEINIYSNNYYLASINANDADNNNGLTLESGFNGDILFKGYDGFTSSTKGGGTKRFFIEGTTGDISFYEDTGTTPKFFWDASAESLGIGTSSLDLVGSTTSLTLDHSGGNGQLSLMGNGTVYGRIFADNATGDLKMGNPTSNDVMFYTANTERMRIDSSGRVGIGTDSPTYKMQVKGDNSASGGILLQGTAGSYGLQIYHNGPADTSYIYNYYSGPMLFGTNNTERMRLDSSGRLGINNSSPSYMIDVIAQSSVVPARLSAASGDAQMYLQYNTSTTGQFIGCNSSGTFQVQRGSDGTTMMSVDTSGTVSAANFNTTSDATLKTNVETLTGSLDAVKAMRGVSFDWIDSGNSEVGVIAQEVEAVIPDVVSTNDQGIKSVKYGNLVAVLIEAIKEQQQRIEALEARLGD